MCLQSKKTEGTTFHRGHKLKMTKPKTFIPSLLSIVLSPPIHTELACVWFAVVIFGAFVPPIFEMSFFSTTRCRFQNGMSKTCLKHENNNSIGVTNHEKYINFFEIRLLT